MMYANGSGPASVIETRVRNGRLLGHAADLLGRARSTGVPSSSLTAMTLFEAQHLTLVHVIPGAQRCDRPSVKQTRVAAGVIVGIGVGVGLDVGSGVGVGRGVGVALGGGGASVTRTKIKPEVAKLELKLRNALMA